MFFYEYNILLHIIYTPHAELARSTWMRFIKFSLFPLAHVALFGIAEKSGTAFTKAMSAIVSSVPEAISIMPLEIAKISLQLDTTNKYVTIDDNTMTPF